MEFTFKNILDTPEYWDKILDWRNSDFVRHNMFDTGIISKSEHYSWLDSLKVNDTKNHYLVLDNVNKPVASTYTYNIDVVSKSLYWGVYLLEESLKGIGSKIIIEFEKFLSQQGFKTFFCEVICSNLAAVKCYEKIQYQRVAEKSNFYLYKKGLIN